MQSQADLLLSDILENISRLMSKVQLNPCNREGTKQQTQPEKPIW